LSWIEAPIPPKPAPTMITSSCGALMWVTVPDRQSCSDRSGTRRLRTATSVAPPQPASTETSSAFDRDRAGRRQPRRPRSMPGSTMPLAGTRPWVRACQQIECQPLIGHGHRRLATVVRMITGDEGQPATGIGGLRPARSSSPGSLAGQLHRERHRHA